MTRLLSSNLTRAFKSKLLWMVAAAAIVFSAMNTGEMLKFYSPAEPEKCMECVFNSVPIVAVLIPAFSGLFLGNDYQCGTLRTKILTGSSREAIYTANFFTVFVCGLIFLCASALPTAAALLLFVDNPAAAIQIFLPGFIAAVMITASLSAIFTLMGMLISSKTMGAVVAILLAFGMLIAGSFVYSKLCEPETVSDMILDVNGKVVEAVPHVNKFYIGGWLRIVFQAVLLILPTGQGILLDNSEMSHYLICCVVSLSVTVITNLFGIMFFSRKDLR